MRRTAPPERPVRAGRSPGLPGLLGVGRRSPRDGVPFHGLAAPLRAAVLLPLAGRDAGRPAAGAPGDPHAHGAVAPVRDAGAARLVPHRRRVIARDTAAARAAEGRAAAGVPRAGDTPRPAL